MARTMDRRGFLALGAASAGAALGCGRDPLEAAVEAGPWQMRYRMLGNTGLEVSEVAFGSHGVDNPPLMASALELGINTFCTSGKYMDGREEKSLGEALKTIGTAREDVVIMTGNEPPVGKSVESITAEIDASLRRLGTDSIDVWFNAMVESTQDVHIEALFEAMEKARTAGKVRHLGMAGHHGGMQELLEAGIESGQYQVLFTKYDFVSYPDQDEILERAARRGIGVMVFKVGAGERVHEISDLEAGGLSFKQATVKWALTNQDIASVAVTFTNFDLLRECAEAVGGRIDAAEVAMLRRYADEMRHRYCRFCTECQSSCPHDVAIADINRHEMYLSCFGRHREARDWYARLPGERTAADCGSCVGPCEKACPFGREVRAGLVAAHRLLDGRMA